jgi:dTDP-D-glucose 4,6-dehydratase
VRAAREFRHEVFLQVSTDEVYGEVMEGRSKENDPLRPRSPYSASKAGAEHIAHAYAASFGVPLLVTRGSNTYGPYQYPEKLIPVLVTNAIDDLALPLYGKGAAVRDYIHVEDHCRAIDLVLHEAPLSGLPTTSARAARQGESRSRKLCWTSLASHTVSSSTSPTARVTITGTRST